MLLTVARDVNRPEGATMIERNGYPAGVPCWVDTNQPDPTAAGDFYAGLFGWEVEDVMPPDAPGRYFIGRLHGGDVGAVSSIPEGAPPVAKWNTYIWVDSADEAAAKIWESGGDVLSEPFDVGDAGRMAVCADPEGATFCLWQAGNHKGSAIVNEPGSVNFNTLSVRDLERAKKFYGAVFGWGALPFGPDSGAWKLPGYAEFLERSDSGLRERNAELGAPEGFADVVAAFATIPADQSDTHAHWGVTFAVADADATAARAAQLGARIDVAPFDAPWVRQTIITDPQGAAFVASQFVPANRDIGAEIDSPVAA